MLTQSSRIEYTQAARRRIHPRSVLSTLALNPETGYKRNDVVLGQPTDVFPVNTELPFRAPNARVV